LAQGRRSGAECSERSIAGAMRCALVLIASQAALGLLSRKPPLAKPVTIHAHLAAADSLSAGLDASTQLANSEHLRLEGVIANLHAELTAAELEHARNAKKAAPTMPPLPAVLPTPLLPRTEVLAKKMLQDTLRMLLDHKINSTTQLVMEVAQKAGEHVASAAADAAAQHASEVAAKQLVTFACDFAAGPSPDAAAAGALVASNTSWTTPDQKEEAAELARGAAEDDVVNACLDEALPLMDYAAGNATEKATAAAVASAVAAAQTAAHKAAHPAAVASADKEFLRVIVQEQERLSNASRAAALRALANDNSTDAAYPTGTDQVNARTAQILDVTEAAAKVIAGAEKVAADAALRAAAPDIPQRVKKALLPKHVHINKVVDNQTADLLYDSANDLSVLMPLAIEGGEGFAH